MLDSQEKDISHKRKILIFEDSFSIAEHLLKMWIEIAQQSVEQSNRFTAALSGGRSPMEFYSRLSSYKDFDLWNRTHLFRSEEHTSELQSHSFISYAVFCLKKKNK